MLFELVQDPNLLMLVQGPNLMMQGPTLMMHTKSELQEYSGVQEKILMKVEVHRSVCCSSAYSLLLMLVHDPNWLMLVHDPNWLMLVQDPNWLMLLVQDPNVLQEPNVPSWETAEVDMSVCCSSANSLVKNSFPMACLSPMEETDIFVPWDLHWEMPWLRRLCCIESNA